LSDWPLTPEKWGVDNWVIGPTHPLSLGTSIRVATNASLTTSTAWPAANLAKFIPFRLPRQVTAYQMAWGAGASTAGGDAYDIGLYDEWGNLLVSSGATASAVTSAEVIVNITDTVIGPGLYYMAFSANQTTRTTIGASASITGLVKCVGVREMASAHALPNPATMATVTDTYIPAISVWLRSE
jgi:hypothetical protein